MITVYSIKEVIEILKLYPPQKIEIADQIRNLRIGWKISNPELHITIPLMEAKAIFPKALFELCMSDEGRKALVVILYEKAWAIR